MCMLFNALIRRRDYLLELSLLFLLFCNKVVLPQHPQKAHKESRVSCTGLSILCTTENRREQCTIKPHDAHPYHTKTCLLEKVCVTNKVIELYSNSLYVHAFNKYALSIDPLGEDKSAHRKHSIIHVHPLENQGSNGELHEEQYDPIVTVQMDFLDNINPGHIWGDTIWPVFRMLYEFSLETQPFQMWLYIGTGGFEPTYQKLNKNIFDVFKPQKVIEVFEDHLPTNPATQCYEKLLVGSAGMSYSEGATPTRTFQDYRQFVMKKLGYRPEEMKLPRTKPRISILMKELIPGHSMCRINNVKEIEMMIAQKFPGVMVNQYNWMNMALLQQVAHMQNTDIVISHPGSDIMNAMFLPDGSTILIPCRKLPDWGIDMSNEVRIWFKNVPTFSVIEICGDEDVTYETPHSYLNITHITRYIEIAIHDWYLHNNQQPPQQIAYVS
mmetsp:Transcript_21741/g.36372  ORF Transcript_21741/g.36372 Transcript_21741/m.36372 type:complete len:440 (+) Transcript_21741:68-1387(+)